jgi:hypothetical protein
MTTKSKKLTSADRFRAVILLRMCRTAQSELWNRSLDLEKILGCAVDTTLDLENETLATILKRNQPI